nr:ABC-ATPase domain-containing protein [Bacilli bacterium]
MESKAHFERLLRGLDGKSYQQYKSLAGAFDLGVYTLHLDHIQADPFAFPTTARLVVPADFLRLPSSWLSDQECMVAIVDFLTRRLFEAAKTFRNRRGSGRSGALLIDQPLQTVLARSSVLIENETIEVRLSLGLPADGRKIRAKEAEAMFLEDIPMILDMSLSRRHFPFAELEDHIALHRDQNYLRNSLSKKGLLAFIADGSILARKSGISDLPLDEDSAVKFVAPDTLRVTFTLPSGKIVSGMGIREGITLIVGGGFHGKSTLLQAIASGVYNHISGDGREYCIAVDTCVKVRAQDGRRVSRVDISGFIAHLPKGRSTQSFSTSDASGSTSQAAAIVEAMELGAQVLLIDEDTSATNFMIRDARMQKLVDTSKEPITPFIDRVKELYRGFGISSILVIGGSGDYLDVATTVIMLDEYQPLDVTKEARAIMESMPLLRKSEANAPLAPLRTRFPQPIPEGKSLERMEAKSRFSLVYGEEFIDVSVLEQLIEESQLRTIVAMLRYAMQNYVDGRRSMADIVQYLTKIVREEGFAFINPYEGCSGFYSMPRSIEIGLVWNRIRGLKIR